MNRVLVTARNDSFPALNHSAALSSRRGLTARGNSAPSVSAMLSEGASSYTYDATADQWIVPPSTTVVDAGASAEPRHTHYAAPKRPAAVPELQAAGRVDLLADVLTVAAGLSVFGSIAYLFLVIA